jgi:hypothetical protein
VEKFTIIKNCNIFESYQCWFKCSSFAHMSVSILQVCAKNIPIIL